MERVEASVVGHCREEYDTDSDTTNNMNADAVDYKPLQSRNEIVFVLVGTQHWIQSQLGIDVPYTRAVRCDMCTEDEDVVANSCRTITSASFTDIWWMFVGECLTSHSQNHS
eukprot:m.748757 g.748757  ORF g.748757 m.748757 type:complete len:112 (+) comp23148_c0_seq84:1-336(+)